MNTAEKVRFVRELVDSVQQEVLQKILTGVVPEEWDGIELRQYLAEKFLEATYKMDRRRRRAYDNAIAISANL